EGLIRRARRQCFVRDVDQDGAAVLRLRIDVHLVAQVRPYRDVELQVIAVATRNGLFGTRIDSADYRTVRLRRRLSQIARRRVIVFTIIVAQWPMPSLDRRRGAGGRQTHCPPPPSNPTSDAIVPRSRAVVKGQGGRGAVLF